MWGTMCEFKQTWCMWSIMCEYKQILRVWELTTASAATLRRLRGGGDRGVWRRNQCATNYSTSTQRPSQTASAPQPPGHRKQRHHHNHPAGPAFDMTYCTRFDTTAVGWLVGWCLNVPATCLCVSGTDLPRQLLVLPH